MNRLELRFVGERVGKPMNLSLVRVDLMKQLRVLVKNQVEGFNLKPMKEIVIEDIWKSWRSFKSRGEHSEVAPNSKVIASIHLQSQQKTNQRFQHLLPYFPSTQRHQTATNPFPFNTVALQNNRHSDERFLS
jgi:hypothetical protein